MWVRLDDGFPEHPKVGDLTDRQFRVHVTAMCYAARNGTDGIIPRYSLPARCTPADTKAFIDAGLWEPVGNGWRIHDWTDWNPTAAQRKLDKERKAQATKEWRQRRNGTHHQT